MEKETLKEQQRILKQLAENTDSLSIIDPNLPAFKAFLPDDLAKKVQPYRLAQAIVKRHVRKASLEELSPLSQGR